MEEGAAATVAAVDVVMEEATAADAEMAAVVVTTVIAIVAEATAVVVVKVVSAVLMVLAHAMGVGAAVAAGVIITANKFGMYMQKRLHWSLLLLLEANP